MQRVEKFDQHGGLRIRTLFGPLRYVGTTRAHQVRRNTTPLGRQPIQCTSPLISAQGEAMQKQSGWTPAPLGIRDPAAPRQLDKFLAGLKLPCILRARRLRASLLS